ncbi:hypothetical protein EOE67_16100 [Rheinheimera riviphila]|uniref:Uncharacterized protein n=1 Tax=Rheinheimera riviphila TaxID=1834037 RepID=A0A437QG58_9GAMM|nr:hypothetical protein [Rheinheimera riviphila]RVU33538.1 hypothetical protein EOE67_16100 [Rheinheimera riviphila]
MFGLIEVTMNKSRQQAHFRKRVAIVLFVLAALIVIASMFGISSPNTETAKTSMEAAGRKTGFYLVPALFALVGWFFYSSAQSKALEAESIETSSATKT